MYKIAEKKSNQRLVDWYNFRQQLEQSKSPLEDTVDYFSKVPRVKIYTDPYDQSTWPTAWELIDENEYCQFNIVLAVCYTLQLLDKFKDTPATVKISIDNVNKVVYYLLFVDDKVYGYDPDGWISAADLPKTLSNIKIYMMPPLH